MTSPGDENIGQDSEDLAYTYIQGISTDPDVEAQPLPATDPQEE